MQIRLLACSMSTGVGEPVLHSQMPAGKDWAHAVMAPALSVSRGLDKPGPICGQMRCM